MAEKKTSFEDQMNELEEIVSNLENGNVPLEEALKDFQKGVKLSGELQKKLTDAEETVTKLMDKEGNLRPLDLPEDENSAN